jgi:hypothetical protein
MESKNIINQKMAAMNGSERHFCFRCKESLDLYRKQYAKSVML